MPWPLFTPGEDPVPIAQEAGWAPGPVWTGSENLAPTGIRSPDRPAFSQSLYRLSYPAHICNHTQEKKTQTTASDTFRGNGTLDNVTAVSQQECKLCTPYAAHRITNVFLKFRMFRMLFCGKTLECNFIYGHLKKTILPASLNEILRKALISQFAQIG